jgi:hypothetical protein
MPAPPRAAFFAKYFISKTVNIGTGVVNRIQPELLGKPRWMIIFIHADDPMKGKHMFQLLQKPKDAILALHITGEISDRETDRLVRIIRKHASHRQKARMFLLMDHYRSFNSAESLYEDLRFTRRCDDLIQCMAIVGDPSWKDTWVALYGLFSGIETAYFERAEAQVALQWLQKPQPARAH